MHLLREQAAAGGAAGGARHARQGAAQHCGQPQHLPHALWDGPLPRHPAWGKYDSTWSHYHAYIRVLNEMDDLVIGAAGVQQHHAL